MQLGNDQQPGINSKLIKKNRTDGADQAVWLRRY